MIGKIYATMALQQEVGRTLQQLAAAETPEAHKAIIHATSPEGAKALATVAMELHRVGHGPDTPLGKAQLALLAHPSATHDDFKAAAEDQHGEGLGSWFAGMSKGAFAAPFRGIGKGLFGNPFVSFFANQFAKSAEHAARR